MDINKLLVLLAPYSLTVSLLYLFGFWSSFEVNILEYIAITDVVKHALSPLLASSIFIFIGLLIAQFVASPLKGILPAGGGRDLPEAKYVRGSFYIVGTLLLLATLYVIFFTAGNMKWLKVAILLQVPITVIIGTASFAEKYIEQPKFRIVVINSLFIVLSYAFGWGAQNAQSIIKSEETITINSKLLNQNYIGWAGEFLFLWDYSNNSITITHKSLITSIERTIPVDKTTSSFSASED
tara:strand:+ start:137 stop:853 length:717 start_codon:yes stop_codon:yes gene_type:complete